MVIFIYLVPATGISMSVHYCGKKISSVKLFEKEKQCCCKGMKNKMPKKCCSSDTQHFHFKYPSKSASSHSITVEPALKYLPLSQQIFFIPCQVSISLTTRYLHPPGKTEPVYLTVSSFLI
jgi:hypothetical protein